MKTNTSDSNYLINVEAQFQRGFLAHQKGLISEAEACYRHALQLLPKHAGALHLLGVLYAQRGRYDTAVQFISKAATSSPHDFSIQNNLGNAFIKLGQHRSALRALDKAIKLKADSAEAWNNRGNALSGLEKYEEALSSYDESLKLRPDYAEAFCNRANTLLKVARSAEALECVEQALQLEPSMPLAHNTKGNTLYSLNQTAAAMRSFDASLTLRPDYALPHFGRGLCFVRLNRTDEAVLEFERALSINPEFVEVYPELASALFKVKRYDEALVINDRAIALAAGKSNVLGARTLLKTHICNWSNLDIQLQELFSGICSGNMVALPFHVLSVTDDLSLHRRAAEIYIKNRFPPHVGIAPKEKTTADHRIKIGYYSADFHDHATMRLMAEFFELHDRKRFEICAFSFGPPSDGVMRKRAISAFDQFTDVNDQSDIEVAEMSRRMGVDIAVDLKGLTGDCRLGIFAARAAPIQVNYLGYPGTVGADYIDYILADPVLIPQNQYPSYAEKVVQLPHTYQVNDRKRPLPKGDLTRAECGLPDDGFIYCCFNNNYKISADMFDVWMRVLHRVPNSFLWLFSDNPKAEENLKKEALARGIALERLIFAYRVDYEENLGRQPLADLFLDTFPYNAHTTASDALWAGLPVLTLQGQSFAARVGSSLLHAAGLPELVTTSSKAYEELAVILALEPHRLASFKSTLIAARTTASLFDTPLLTRDIESAYRAMFDRYQADLPPDHLVI